MKRFTLILSLMVAMVTTAMAQITSLGELSNEKTYVIQSKRCWLAYNEANPTKLCTTNANNWEGNLEATNEDLQFKILNEEGAYYLFSVAANKYVTKNGEFSDTKDGALNLTDQGGNEYRWLLTVGGNGLNTQIRGQYAEGIVVNSWATADDGNMFNIIDVETYKAPVYVSALADFNPNKAYTLTTKERGAWTVNNELTELSTTSSAGQAVDATDAKQHFAVLTLDNENYYLFNVAANKFVKSKYTLIAAKGTPIQLNDATSEGANRMQIQYVGDANGYFNIGGSSQRDICGWSAIDHGNAVLFTEVADFDPTAALEMLEKELVEITYNFTYKGETEYTQTVTTAVGEEYPAITVAFPFGITATKPAGTIAADAETTVTIALEENLPFAYYSSYSTIENWYYVKLKGANYLYHEADKDHIALDQTTVAADNKDAFSWAFVGDPINGFQVVNMAAGEGYVLSSTTSITDDANTHPVMTATPVAEGNNELWVLTASTYQENGFYMAQKDFASNRMNNRNNKLAYWTGGADNGSTFTVEERLTAKAELLALAAQAEALLAQITIGEAIGQYSSNYEGYAAAYAEIAAYVEGGEIEEAVAEEYVATLSAIMNSFSVNGLVAGKYYTFSNGGYYITSGVTEGGRIACSETKDATAIYYFDGSHLLAYTTGLYFGLNANDWTFEAVGSEDISKITFAAVNGGTANVLNICSDARWLHRTDAYINRCSNNTCGALHEWTIEEVTSLPVSITAAGYATFFAPVAVTVPSGVTAHTVTVDGDKAILSEALTVIPANTGVVLAGAANAYDFTITTAAAFEGENLMAGTVAKTLVAKAENTEYYVLANGEEGVGLYVAVNGEDTTKFYNAGHKAYLAVEGASGIKSYSFRFEGATTGIENVEVESASNVIYDLTGRRVEIAERGIYIINGKKVLVK